MSKALMSARARTRQDHESLEGITLLRYAHIYRDRTSGGAEQYLRQLNRGLLTRHGMTILQMHRVNGDETSFAPEVEVLGRGRLIWVPVKVYVEKRSVGSLLKSPEADARQVSTQQFLRRPAVPDDGLERRAWRPPGRVRRRPHPVPLVELRRRYAGLAGGEQGHPVCHHQSFRQQPFQYDEGPSMDRPGCRARWGLGPECAGRSQRPYVNLSTLSFSSVKERQARGKM
jgi:hypothetical protein